MLFKAANNKVIIEKTKIANTIFSRFKGLMFEKREKFDYALIFELQEETKLSASIHMMFVFFPIDVVYLDSKKNVVDKTIAFPWQMNYTPKKDAKYFIELPKGMGDRILLGEKLDWNYA